MKVIAVLLLLGAVVYARPGGDKKPGLADAGALAKLEGGDEPDQGTVLFMKLVGLCVRLAEENGFDRRSQEEVVASFGLICQALKDVLDNEIENGLDEKRGLDQGDKKRKPKSGSRDEFKSGFKSAFFSGDGPLPTGEPDSRSFGDEKRPMKSGSKDGPSPTGDPMDSRSFGDKKRPMKSGSKDGPSPTGDPMDSRSFGDKKRPMKSGSKDGPSPTGDPMDSRSFGDKKRPMKSGSKDGPSPTGDPMDSRSFGDKSPMKSGSRDGPSPTGDPMDSRSFGDKKRPMKSGSKDGPSPTGDPMDSRSVTGAPAKPKQSVFDDLLDLCSGLAKLAMEMEKDEKRSEEELEKVLAGMENVCLAAFKEAA